jgi:membrane carboxypeptidase/penicillin-binding protein
MLNMNGTPNRQLIRGVAMQMQIMMRGWSRRTAGSMMANKELAKRTICGKTGTVNDFTDDGLSATRQPHRRAWIGYPGLKKTLGNREAGCCAADVHPLHGKVPEG